MNSEDISKSVVRASLSRFRVIVKKLFSNEYKMQSSGERKFGNQSSNFNNRNLKSEAINNSKLPNSCVEQKIIKCFNCGRQVHKAAFCRIQANTADKICFIVETNYL